MSEGAGTVEVCAVVQQGSLDREVILELSTSDKTALSKYCNLAHSYRQRYICRIQN